MKNGKTYKFNSTIWWMSNDWNKSRLLDYIMDFTVTMRENVRSDWRKYSFHNIAFPMKRLQHMCVCVCVCVNKAAAVCFQWKCSTYKIWTKQKKTFRFNLTNIFDIQKKKRETVFFQSEKKTLQRDAKNIVNVYCWIHEKKNGNVMRHITERMFS